MRIINKKYLLIILLVGIILTGAIILKLKEEVKLDNVILKQEVNNKTFAMYKEEDENNYVIVEDNKFPEMYVLNLTESKCIDNNGNEIKNALSYENGKVTITSGKTIYCYLYFDKTLGVEIKEKEPKGLKTDAIRGAMYRYQGQAKDSEGNELVNNYICFGTSDKDTCKSDTDKYMYRIIGIEAETGRVKVIKMKALKQTYQWWNNYDDDIEFPKSKIYTAINGTDFLKNADYVPADWEEKISNNTWMYGDMLSDDQMGARQIGEELYLAETGQKETIWDAKANEGDEGAQSSYIDSKYSDYTGETIYYIRHNNEKWTKSFKSKVSLMYLHDYYLAVNDDANCQFNEKKYDGCKSSWLHLSNNDVEVQEYGEWTMNRLGWTIWAGFFIGAYIYNTGGTSTGSLIADLLVRPVFYISASEKLFDGIGSLYDPFIIKN